MSQAATRYLGLLIGVLAAGMVVVVLVPRLFGVATGPESELIALLKQSEAEPLEYALPGLGTLKSKRHRFERFSISYDPGSNLAWVAATLDFDGTFGPTEVSSLGVEKIAFHQRDGSWEPDRGLAPYLAAVVGALERRRRALEGMDTAALRGLTLPEQPELTDDPRSLEALRRMRDRRYLVKAWFIRVERDGAEVTEDYRVLGELPEQPVDLTGSTQLALHRREGEFYFGPGLR